MLTDDEQLALITERAERLMRRFMPRQVRYRYFEHGQRMFCWSTEPMRVDGPFVSWEYVPTGPGARTGKAARWEARNKREHRLRRQAKARALSMYEKAKAS